MMEALRLKPRQPVEHEPELENWDDDDFMLDDGDDLTFRSSTNTNNPPTRRDSISSHRSLRSEFESVHGEEERQVHIADDDEKSTLNAIAAAANIGIPIPKNVPPSALMGGTIKRLGGRKIKKIIEDDWEADLELPDTGKALTIKAQDASQFPDAIRQVSGGSVHTSPVKSSRPPPAIIHDDRRDSNQSRSSVLGAAINLDRFRDDGDDDDFFGDGSATIKVSKTRSLSKPISLITPPTPQKALKPQPQGEDDFELDLELPSDGKLKLSTRKDIPKTPSLGMDDLDWGEGSLGTRYGGTRRDGRSNRSSSASALSPSISSSITAESEDETFDGLVLPPGPVNFEQRLKLRRKSRSPERIEEEPAVPVKKSLEADADREDFFSGLDIGDGAVFDSKKSTFHQNIKLKDTRPESPSRPKAAVSLTFTNKPVSQLPSRLPRLSHDRAPSNLEPVSESGGPILPRIRRSQSRLGHSAQSSVSSLPTPTTPSSSSSMPPSTPRRTAREITTKTSAVSLRNEPTTTNAQLLRLKRSLPAMRAPQSPAKPTATSRYDRPPSRTDGRPGSAMRPKTPVDRIRPDSSSSMAPPPRRNPPPFLPAGSSNSSHHVTAKGGRVFRRHDSENSIDFRPSSRTVSRSTMRSPSPRRQRLAHEKITETHYRLLSRPRHQRTFGNGSELDGFDDLPVSRDAEARYVKQPVAKESKTLLRNKIYQNVLPDRSTTSSPVSPYSPMRSDYTPSFARDTAASRIARETSLAQRVPSSGPLAPLTTQRVAQLSARSNLNPMAPPSPQIRSKKKRSQQLKPHLIANLNPAKESKTVNGMVYNPNTFRWEGNDNVLSAFDPPASSPSTTSLPPYMLREKENATPRPALITNISSTKGVQVVGGMVFDPQNMCWLKIGNSGKPVSEAGDPLDGFNGLDDDDDDPFKDIPDLEDNAADSNDGVQGRVSEVRDDWLVGEEFDVGPEFVRRQREEEERWRKKCESWLSGSNRNHDEWRWTIRELISGDALF
ncbi:hypothetical protein jhhlp_004330 [Lomentospora prolificans]|uniref:Cytokinesis regulator n=1 Tax=Lomentospora prolificans TaxID=41688 RepID=A0A2N3NB99_9PEZI|nr:hypothetical protein jhhlp_004330 [Lomentospora prolificans]